LEEETGIKDVISSTIAGITESVKDKDVALLGVVEFELSVITQKTAGGKAKLVLVEAGADYRKEQISKIKFYIGTKSGEFYRVFGWK